jgi:hypothetical protein
MPSQKPSSLRRVSLSGFALLILFLPAFAQTQQSQSLSEQEWRRRLSEGRRQMLGPFVGLEVISSHKTEPVYKGMVGPFTLFRESLVIVDQEAAKDVYFVQVQAAAGPGSVNVRILVNYNKPSEPEWWKNKKEKEVGQFTVGYGESLRPAELKQFGIEPFEIKVIDGKPVALKRDEYPRIVNPSAALEVTEVEKSPIGYRFSFKNISNKDIAVLEIYSGTDGLGGGDLGYRGRDAFLPAGQIYEENRALSALDVEKHGLTVKMILYMDGTYEGDAKAATRHLARGAGYNIQAAKLLPKLQEAFNVSDDELPQFLLKMETDLWQMPEAMDKASSIELLKIKYPAFDEQTIAELYEEFKSGFYIARNTLLVELGQIKDRIGKPLEHESAADQVKLFRYIVTHLKEVIEKAASSNN